MPQGAGQSAENIRKILNEIMLESSGPSAKISSVFPVQMTYTSSEFSVAILDSLPNLVFVKDDEMRFVYVNEPLAKVFNTSRDNMLGKRDGDFIENEEQVVQFRNADRRVLLTKESLKITEEFLSDAQGQVRRLATTKVHMLLGQKSHVLGIATDITDIPSNASETDALRVAIISDLAHVIKSPIATAAFNLNAIRLELRRYRLRPSAWFAREGFRPDRVRANLHFIHQSLLAVNITSRTFAAIAQSLHQRTRTPCLERHSIHSLLRELSSEIGQILPQHQLFLHVETDAQGAYALLDTTDVGLVKTAFYNIVHNALKFTPSQSPVAISLLLSKNGPLTVQVADEGGGIAPDDLGRVFEPGFSRRAQGHAAGTGMGLTIAQETFVRLGWTIDITSVIGKGTVVRVSIPKYVF